MMPTRVHFCDLLAHIRKTVLTAVLLMYAICLATPALAAEE
jgi:hypothetical protein